MASLNLAPEELKQLELLRNRFAQLTNSLQSLRANVINSNPLPSRESLQASSAILQQNIRSIRDLTTDNADLFQRIAIHPSTNFPGRTQEHVLLQLLRKKLEPDVESWVEEARETARAAGLDASKLATGARAPGAGGGAGGNGYESEEDTYGLDREDEVPSDPFNEQWADILDAFQTSLMEYVTVQVKKKYTVEEQAMGVENVRTGLKRDLEESDEEEDGEDEDEDEDEEAGGESAAAQGDTEVSTAGAGARTAASEKLPIQPEHLFWLSVKGDFNLPRNVEFESRRKVTQKTKRPAPPR
ncbi:Mediator of RNA polymerase II transcription subunit 8 [Madurella mycetomatis]|uniref:Mediator of RNA polymerase II transcription subunit 8 n=1 Tax=Madurella mycetomatis TaxID=100816 RepID=A0A175WIH5_9PEZI|nr:Mediator of RNA polymerase II transcription subunit 8 [Madurella mycetomatis]